MGVGVFNLFLVKKSPQLLKLSDDMLVAVENLHAFKKFYLIEKFASLVYRRIDIETVFNPCFIVFLSMAGRRVNCSGSRI